MNNSFYLRSFKRVFGVLTAVLFGFSLAPAAVSNIISYCLLCVVLFFLFFPLFRNKIASQQKFRPITSLGAGILVFYIGDFFFKRWIPSNKIRILAEAVGVDDILFLRLITILICLNDFFVIVNLIEAIRTTYNKSSRYKCAFVCMASVLISAVEYIQIEYSVLQTFDAVKPQGIVLFLLNTCVVLLFNLFLVLIFQRWSTALIASSLFITLWSLVNYYVQDFHGAPLFFSELRNVRTGFNVAFSYSLQISGAIVNLLLLFALELFFVWVWFDFLNNKGNIRIIAIRLLLFGGNVLLVYVCFFATSIFKPYKAVGWSWVYACSLNGTCSCMLEDLGHVLNPYKIPEGYNVERLRNIKNVESEDNNSDSVIQKPDIILILNETFCDLNYICDITYESEAWKKFYNISDAVYGYATVSSVGGGTNNSEFELLTSKSMFLLNAPAPFNYIDFNVADSSAISYFNTLGYSTTAMHCGDKTNYSRNRAYPELGFSSCIQGEDLFTKTFYGKRPWLDHDNYQDLINVYNSQKGDAQFIYLLTYQNHGGYNQNDASFDTVHIKQEYGELTNEIDEYLSSVELSCEAFIELTEYFKTIDRPVIICMIGDHAPSFVSRMNIKTEIDDIELPFASLLVPYVIWSNYGLEIKQTSKYASMTDLVPLLTESTGLPVSAFYEKILSLHKELPIRTSSGIYLDKNGTIGTYSNESPYYEELSEYYYMEFNSLNYNGEYLKELFFP